MDIHEEPEAPSMADCGEEEPRKRRGWEAAIEVVCRTDRIYGMGEGGGASTYVSGNAGMRSKMARMLNWVEDKMDTHRKRNYMPTWWWG